LVLHTYLEYNTVVVENNVRREESRIIDVSEPLTSI
jgi:hypothetical protein